MERITVRAERLFESERVFYGKVGDRPGELLAMELGLTSMLVGKPPPVPGWLYLQVEGLRFVLDSALRDRVVTAAVDQGLCDEPLGAPPAGRRAGGLAWAERLRSRLMRAIGWESGWAELRWVAVAGWPRRRLVMASETVLLLLVDHPEYWRNVIAERASFVPRGALSLSRPRADDRSLSPGGAS